MIPKFAYEHCKQMVCKDFRDDEFDNAQFDLLVQACRVHACKDCTKVKCEGCICLETMNATLNSVGFGANLCRRAPLWVLPVCCLTIQKFKLGTTSGTRNGKNFCRMHSSTSEERQDNQQFYQEISPMFLTGRLDESKILRNLLIT